MAKGIDNSKAYPEIEQFLDESIQTAMQRFEGKKVKEEPDILPYREAFRALNINPNKYFCSIEALFTRIAKAKGCRISILSWHLGNAVSLKYTLPMGAHDLGGSKEDICIRLARPEDTFLEFGGEKERDAGSRRSGLCGRESGAHPSLDLETKRKRKNHAQLHRYLLPHRRLHRLQPGTV